MTSIIPIPAFKDNYIWAIHNMSGTHVILVDPGEAGPVLEYTKKNQLTVDAIFITHHHFDHCAGVPALRLAYPHIKIYAPQKEVISGVTHRVKEGDKIDMESYNLTFQVLEIPGHTLGHVAYVVDKYSLFCGDTLFSCGCGRLFEGTPAQMVASLEKLKQLSSETRLYCGHEYTLQNIQFAQQVDPENEALKTRKKAVEITRRFQRPSLPVTLGEEMHTNPFLRCDNEAIVRAVQAHAQRPLSNYVEIFGHLREWKNSSS